MAPELLNKDSNSSTEMGGEQYGAEDGCPGNAVQDGEYQDDYPQWLHQAIGEIKADGALYRRCGAKDFHGGVNNEKQDAQTADDAASPKCDFVLHDFVCVSYHRESYQHH